MILEAHTPIYPKMPELDKWRAKADEAGSVTKLSQEDSDGYYKALCNSIYRLNVARLQSGLGFSAAPRSLTYISPGSKKGIAALRRQTKAAFHAAADVDRRRRTDQEIIDEYNRVMGRSNVNDQTNTEAERNESIPASRRAAGRR